MGKKTFFHVVARGRKTGIFGSWDDCFPQVSGFKGAIYKKFKTEEEAKMFLENPSDRFALQPQVRPTLKAQLDSSSLLNKSAFQSTRSKSYDLDEGEYDRCSPSSMQTFSTSARHVYEGLILDQDGYVIVYTDGACENNGAPSGTKAGIGVFWNHGHAWNISEGG